MGERVCYLSGPMTGLPDFNHPAFATAATNLRSRGWVVLSPAEHDNGTQGHSRSHYMRHDIQQLLMADAVFVLDGWETSAGARLEIAVAREIGLPVHFAELFGEACDVPLHILVSVVPGETTKEQRPLGPQPQETT
jgi:hypothetical protein